MERERIVTTVSRTLRQAPVAFLLVGLLGCGEGDFPLAASVGLAPEVEAFVDLMNEHRVTVGCTALVWNDDVAQVARAHSVDMTERGFFAHDNPDGLSPFDRLTNAGITYHRAAENIAGGYATGAGVLQGWLASPGHRSNIEDCQLTEHGVGKFEAVWTHLFITP